MKKIFLSIFLLALMSCEEDYIAFLNSVNKEPILKVRDKSGNLVTEFSDALKLPSDFKQERPDFYVIDANATDPEGQLQSLSARVVIGTGTFSDINVSSDGTAEIIYTPDPGDLSVHTLELTATDNLGNQAKATITLEVYVNKLPTASFTLKKIAEHSPYEYILDAKASSDPDEAAGGGIVKLEWVISGTTYVDPLVNENGEFDGFRETGHIFNTPGNYTITLVAIDNDGGRSVVTPNQSFTIN